MCRVSIKGIPYYWRERREREERDKELGLVEGS